MSQTIYLSEGAGEAEIRSAVSSLTSGGTIVLPKDADITINKTIAISVGASDITLDLNGATLHQGGTQVVLAATGVETPLQSVAIASDANSNATITYDAVPTNLTVGSWVKVTADDALPGDHIDTGDKGNPTLLGQAAEVIAIDGNTVTLEGGLVEQALYQTNVRATIYSEGQFTLKDGTIDGSAADYTASTADLVSLRNLVDAQVSNVNVQDGSYGINVVNNVNAQLTDVVATNLWGGVHSATSLNTVVDGLFAEHVGHGILVHGVGTVAGAATASTYGADIGLLGENSVVYDASKAAYDFHSESRDGVYSNDLTFDSRMFGDFRGIGNSFIDSAGAGNDYGVQFYEYGDGDGRNSTISNLVLRETANYSFIVSGAPADNLVENSSFESYGKGYSINPAVVEFVNVVNKQNVVGDADILAGTDAADKLLGGTGVDQLSGGAGNDYLWGGAEADTIVGGEGRDRFAYNALSEGGDTIGDFHTGSGGDILDVSVLGARLGWDSTDFISDGLIRAVQSGANTLVQANDGTDWVNLATLSGVTAKSFSLANVQMSLSDPLALQAESQPTSHSGTDGANFFSAATGADLYNGSLGNDSYVFNDLGDRVVNEVAGGGDDTIQTTVTVDLGTQSMVENLRLLGTEAIDATGNQLNNLITGNAASNMISGGAGNDKLYGKGGADTFHFADMGAAHTDTVLDFGADDRVSLDASVFAGLDANADGLVDAASFTTGAVTGTEAMLAYSKASGTVSYDADGAGSGLAQDVAVIGKNLAYIDSDHFLIV